MSAADAKEWQTEGLQLAQAHKRHQWKIADWILEGIALHTSATEAYDIAEQVFPEYSRTTFMEWASVARTFPPLVRTKDFPDLYFGHFKTALAVNSVPENAEETARLRMEWLKQAQDKKLSVAAFRLAIYDAFALVQPKPKPEQEPAAPAPRPPKTAGQRGLEYNLPLSAIEHQNLEKLALARGVSPAMLAKLILVEYLDAHSDEFVVAERRRAEAKAVSAAAQAVWDVEVARRNEAWKKAEAYRQKRESITNSLGPLWHHAIKTQNKSLRETIQDTRGWFIQNPTLPIEELEARVNELLAAHLPDAAEAALLAAGNEPATPTQEAPPAEVVPPEGEIPFEQAAATSAGS